MTRNHPEKEIEGLVFCEQVALAYRLGPPSVVLSLVPIVFIWWVIHPVCPGLRSNGWLAVSLFFVTVRLIIAYFYKRRKATPDAAWFWGFLFSLCMFVTGLLWGYAGIALFPVGHPYLQVLLMITIAGTAAGHLPFVMPLRWTYASLVFSMMLPFAAYMIYLGSTEQMLVGVLTICFVGFMLFSSVGMGRTVVENISSRFRQALLAEEVRDSQERTEKANRLLSDEIEERKRAEEALRDSEALFRAAFETSAIGMALVALYGRYLRVNRSLCVFLGYSEEELLKKTFREITHPDDLENDLEHIRRLMRDDISDYRIEKRYLHMDGYIVWGSLSVAVVRDGRGRPLHFVVQIEDITERKLFEEKMKRRKNLMGQEENEPLTL